MTTPKNVQPIRSQQQLDDMKWALKRHCLPRDYILFVLGCETGLRVGDLLKIKTEAILRLKNKKEGFTSKRRKNPKNPRYLYWPLF